MGSVLPEAAIKAGVPDTYATSFQRDVGAGVTVGVSWRKKMGEVSMGSLGSRKNHRLLWMCAD